MCGPEMPFVESIAKQDKQVSICQDFSCGQDHEQPLLSFPRHNMKYNILACACLCMWCCGVVMSA